MATTVAKMPALERCTECLSTGCHRADCETGKRQRAEREAARKAEALVAPPTNRMMRSPFRKK
jgi:hypothetical protein